MEMKLSPTEYFINTAQILTGAGVECTQSVIHQKVLANTRGTACPYKLLLTCGNVQI